MSVRCWAHLPSFHSLAIMSCRCTWRAAATIKALACTLRKLHQEAGNDVHYSSSRLPLWCLASLLCCLHGSICIGDNHARRLAAGMAMQSSCPVPGSMCTLRMPRRSRSGCCTPRRRPPSPALPGRRPTARRATQASHSMLPHLHAPGPERGWAMQARRRAPAPAGLRAQLHGRRGHRVHGLPPATGGRPKSCARRLRPCVACCKRAGDAEATRQRSGCACLCDLGHAKVQTQPAQMVTRLPQWGCT